MEPLRAIYTTEKLAEDPWKDWYGPRYVVYEVKHDVYGKPTSPFAAAFVNNN